MVAEENILAQLSKYMHVDYCIPTKGVDVGKKVNVNDSSVCMIVDQARIYVAKDEQFIESSHDMPIFKREGLRRSELSHVRDYW